MGKKEAIIQAAIEVVAEKGFADTPTIQIARQAGSAENTIFRLFGNKNNLMNATFDIVLERFQEACWQAIEKADSVEKSLAASLKLSISYYRKKPEELAYIMQYMNSSIGILRRPDIRYENGEDMTDFPVISLLAQGKKEGIFKNLSMTALIAMSTVPMLMFLREEQIRNIKHSNADYELLISTCLQGIKQ
jgi:AcrR family transcriptional regulator